MQMIDLDIIQPCYNPTLGWEESVWLHFQVIMKLLPDVNVNLIIVNDGSRVDGTVKSIAYLRDRIKNFQFISYDQNRGKGYALRQGLKASRGPFRFIQISIFLTN